jgi:peptide deformylase
MNIVYHPNKFLDIKSSAFDLTNDKIDNYNDIEQFESDMIKLMVGNRGIGLAANQIGITKRFFAIGSDTFDKIQKPVIMWNPEIENESEEKTLDIEGCLSFPNVFLQVLRPKKVDVKWQDKNGTTMRSTLDNYESKCFQHELDHLNGITFNKRVSKLKWDMALKRRDKKDA